MQLILSTPVIIEIDDFLTDLKLVLQTGSVTVLLVRQRELSVSKYMDIVSKIVPMAQTHGCAVLLDDRPELVRQLDADGVQISTGHHDVIAAMNTLKPDFIVGAANLRDRHSAMLCGEAGADYVAFGDFTQPPEKEALDLAEWWANLFEVPCTLFDLISPVEQIAKSPCEFLGLGDNIWQGSTPVSQAIRNLKPIAKTS